MTPHYNATLQDILEDFVIEGAEGRPGERTANLIRAFNVREGFGRKDDALPKRFLTDPLPSGSARGRVVQAGDLNRMLDEFYKVCGWDENGVPTREKLEELGLKEAAQELWSGAEKA